MLVLLCSSSSHIISILFMTDIISVFESIIATFAIIPIDRPLTKWVLACLAGGPIVSILALSNSAYCMRRTESRFELGKLH